MGAEEEGERGRLKFEVRPRANSRELCTGCRMRAPGCRRIQPRRFQPVPVASLPTFFMYPKWRIACSRCRKAIDAMRAADAKHLKEPGEEPAMRKPDRLNEEREPKLAELRNLNLRSVWAFLLNEDLQLLWDRAGRRHVPASCSSAHAGARCPYRSGRCRSRRRCCASTGAWC